MGGHSYFFGSDHSRLIDDDHIGNPVGGSKEVFSCISWCPGNYKRNLIVRFPSLLKVCIREAPAGLSLGGQADKLNGLSFELIYKGNQLSHFFLAAGTPTGAVN